MKSRNQMKKNQLIRMKKNPNRIKMRLNAVKNVRTPKLLKGKRKDKNWI